MPPGPYLAGTQWREHNHRQGLDSSDLAETNYVHRVKVVRFLRKNIDILN
jgi:hypothetical protein